VITAREKCDEPISPRSVLDVGEHEGVDYLVMQFLEGKTLAEMKLPLPIAEVLKIGGQMAEGLAAAWRWRPTGKSFWSTRLSATVTTCRSK
jgi:hypothetical protein